MTGEWNTRTSLLDRSQITNDQEAWSEFVGYYHDFIFMVFLRMGVRPGDIEDYIQDVLLKIWKNIKKFNIDKDRARFRTWLSTLIKNHALDQFKISGRYQKKVEHKASSLTERQVETTLEGNFLESLIEKEWERHVMKVALSNIRGYFSDRAIYVFEQSLLGKSTEELAEELQLKGNSINKLKNRVKLRMIDEVKSLREVALI